MYLQALPLGICDCDETVLMPGEPDSAPVPAPVVSYLVHLDNGELLLIDTGMSRDHIGDPDLTWRGTRTAEHIRALMEAADDIEHQLGLLGIVPADIDHVINTHLHFDHAGNNFLFENATFYAQREHHRFAVGNASFPNAYWNLPGLRFELLDGARELWPGVEVFPTPGHVPGHQSVLVRLPETGPVIICGDAVYFRAIYDHDNWSGSADPAAARETGAMLLDRARRENATLIFGHDVEQATTFERAPHIHA
jgi:N-acyl homoserine lactone hydrolase